MCNIYVNYYFFYITIFNLFLEGTIITKFIDKYLLDIITIFLLNAIFINLPVDFQTSLHILHHENQQTNLLLI